MSDKDERSARKGRFTALVIAGTGPVLGAGHADRWRAGPDTAVRALFDLMALAGFVWAFVLIYQIWRQRRSKG